MKDVMFVPGKLSYHFELRGIPVILRDDVPAGVMYFLNNSYFGTPMRKDGKPDMRYRINKWNTQSDLNTKEKI